MIPVSSSVGCESVVESFFEFYYCRENYYVDRCCSSSAVVSIGAAVAT